MKIKNKEIYPSKILILQSILKNLLAIMSIFIEKIRIKNFRSLKNVSINLSPITVLVGKNNSGKTSFLRALSLAFNGERKFWSQDDLFVDKGGKTLPKKERIITIDVKIVPANGADEFDDSWAYVLRKINTDENGISFFAFRTQINYTKTVKEAKIRRYIINDWDAEDREEEELTADMSSIPFYFIDAQRDLEEDLKFRTSNVGKLVGEIEYDNEQQSEIEGLLAELNSEAVDKSKVLKHLKTTLEELNKTVQTKGEGVEITPFSKKVRDLHKGIKVHFQDGGSDSFSLEYHGMGTRSWASLLALKAKIGWDAQTAEADNDAFFPILALEEPEAHLHPNAQRQVYRQLTSIEGQKIVSTHSPYIAGVASLAELRCFSKEEDMTEVQQLNIDILTPNEQRRVSQEVVDTKGEILFAKAVVLFEGLTEEQILPVFARKYWTTEAFEQGICFVRCNGNNYKIFLKLLSVLNIKWFIFSDYDKVDIKKGVKNALTDCGLNPDVNHSNVILLHKTIEEYLIDEGYQSELKEAIKKAKAEEEVNSQTIEATNGHINQWTDVQILNELKKKGNKTRYAGYYAREIISTSDENQQIPAKIKDLFEAIDSILNQNSEENEATTI